MPLQENNAEINPSPAPKKKICIWIKDLFRNQFVFCGAAPFIFVLVVSYTYMENAPVATLMGYLSESWENENLRKAATLTNLQDFLSDYFEVIVEQISETYTGCFTMITFCTAVSTMGLMLLWISAATTSEFDMVYVAIFLLALGNAGKTLLGDFLEDQLDEKVKAKMESQPKHGNTDKIKKQEDYGIFRTMIWWYPALFAGIFLAATISFAADGQNNVFRFAALLMGGTYLIFFFGCAHQSRNSYKNMPDESTLGKIFRICKAAFRKRKFRYPTSANSYYLKDDKGNHFYYHGQELRLSPQVPRPFRFLDKAAIIAAQSSDSDLSPQGQEKKGMLCTVKDVTAVKRLVPLTYLGFTFFAYSLVVAAGNTFFAGQTAILKPVYTDNNDISFLFAAKSIMRRLSPLICQLLISGFEFGTRRSKTINLRFKCISSTIIRIGIGMVCAIICCITARRVELYRLNGQTSKTTEVLVPQFLLLGIAEGLVRGGLKNLFQRFASKSMWTFDNSFSLMVIGTGKLFTIPAILIFSSWFKETVNTSHLDRYYLLLAILNSVFLLAFGYVFLSFRYACKEEDPNDEEIETEQTLEHARQENPEEANEAEENLAIREGSTVATGHQ